jgi:hypothetical protein
MIAGDEQKLASQVIQTNKLLYVTKGQHSQQVLYWEHHKDMFVAFCVPLFLKYITIMRLSWMWLYYGAGDHYMVSRMNMIFGSVVISRRPYVEPNGGYSNFNKNILLACLYYYICLLLKCLFFTFCKNWKETAKIWDYDSGTTCRIELSGLNCLN